MIGRVKLISKFLEMSAGHHRVTAPFETGAPPLRSTPMTDIRPELSQCTLCADRFAATATGHRPNPVVWFQPGARLLIASQAPGLKVHEANTPFWDASGKRLRDWLGVDETTFYDRSRVAIIPMAFCFPGYDAKGSDLPPPPICAKTWRARALHTVPDVRLTVLIGAYAMRCLLYTSPSPRD